MFPIAPEVDGGRKEQWTWSLFSKGTLSKILICHFSTSSLLFALHASTNVSEEFLKILINSWQLWKEPRAPPTDHAFWGLCGELKNTGGLIEKANVKNPEISRADEETVEKWAHGISQESLMPQRQWGGGGGVGWGRELLGCKWPGASWERKWRFGVCPDLGSLSAVAPNEIPCATFYSR